MSCLQNVPSIKNRSLKQLYLGCSFNYPQYALEISDDDPRACFFVFSVMACVLADAIHVLPDGLIHAGAHVRERA